MNSQKQKTIFLVDDNPANLAIGRELLHEHYRVFAIPSGKRLLQILEKSPMPDMILLDVEMPEMDGYEVIRTVKSDKRTAHIPIIFVTAQNDPQSELDGLSLGAIDYITKPFSPVLLLKRIEVHLLVEDQKHQLQDFNDNLMQMVTEKTQKVITLQNAILRTVAELVECRDDITGWHIERTQEYLEILAKGMLERGVYQDELSSWDMKVFLQSAQLHDVGKITISDNILRKPGKLTAEEFEEMKQHTVFGLRILEKISESTAEDAFLEHAKIVASTHHEKWDGTGYPVGLKAADIPLQGRMMAIVDVYDALISERPYKKPFPHEEAVKIILADKGKAFDPALIDVFQEVSDKFRQVSEAIR